MKIGELVSLVYRIRVGYYPLAIISPLGKG